MRLLFDLVKLAKVQQSTVKTRNTHLSMQFVSTECFFCNGELSNRFSDRFYNLPMAICLQKFDQIRCNISTEFSVWTFAILSNGLNRIISAISQSLVDIADFKFSFGYMVAFQREIAIMNYKSRTCVLAINECMYIYNMYANRNLITLSLSAFSHVQYFEDEFAVLL